MSEGEVSQWAAGGRDAIICSVSHAWETREHPDPCCFQLEQLANRLALYKAAYYSEMWVFYDYTSLFQFRRTAAEEESYQLAMANVQVLYAHTWTLTFRIQDLTPDSVVKGARANLKYKVLVYHESSRGVRQCQLQELVEHRPPYENRGWCRAETEWSSTRSQSWQNQRIDGQSAQVSQSKVPMTPDDFAKHMASAVFTHRDDEKAIVKLQPSIFYQKVTALEDLTMERLSRSGLETLARAFRHYRRARALRLLDFDAGPAEARAFGQASRSCSDCVIRCIIEPKTVMKK